MAETSFQASIEQKIKEWLESGSNELKIVIIGETGVGKSTLTNGIIGEMVANYSSSASSCTQSVVEYKKKVNGIAVSIFDTPGFNDPKKEDKETVDEIVKKTKQEIDLILVCIDIRTRIRRTDMEAFKCLKTLFTSDDQCKRVLVVLTHANMIEGDFKEKYTKMADAIYGYLTKPAYGQLSKAEATQIPVVPAGYKERDLPGISDWLSKIWQIAFDHVNSKQAFIKLIEHRLGIGQKVNDVLPHNRPIDLGGTASSDGNFISYLASTLSNFASKVGIFFRNLFGY